MVDSFFVNPTKRRKTASSSGGSGSNKRAATSNGIRKNGPSRVNGRSNNKSQNGRASDDENNDDEGLESDDLDSDVSMEDDDNVNSDDSEDEFGNETEADKRRRLAKQYLENIQTELTEAGDDAFDAKDLDREIISRRLKEDVAETVGKVYRFIGDSFDFKSVSPKNGTAQLIQAKAYGITSVATNYPFAYTTSKDLTLTKWDISNAKKPRVVRFVKGNHRVKTPEERETFKGHFDEILCVAASSDGKYVVTGGRDRRLVVWSAESLAPIKVFETRDRKGVVMGLVFRRNTNELYASCADLKVRTFNLDQLAQVEILFGHQDEVADIAALGQERCVSVGSRDRTAIIWKIAEETRLTFRGADTVSGSTSNKSGSKSKVNDSGYDAYAPTKKILEGSIDCCSMIDDQLFVTGSDNGNVSLWSVNKKKPLFVLREAHGRDESLLPDQVSAETAAGVSVPPPPALPRYITSIYAIPFSDTFFTGSWDGQIRAWKLSADLRTFEPLATVSGASGIVNRISVVETGSKGKETFTIVGAVAKELRLGRWLKVKGKNGLFTATIARK
ncbi:Rrp9p [Sugiyamaella lignohabitans]|uniref:Rrp9p n=1 Tax=Sugiyamaella lignohabitans TaxID=796027 RepID=A0A167EXM5_9ASCO|nr:Rrp9p [Sugiyamaella lignohabitans]ANB14578.1 Rrp9p [Sugiyamaella lignohabitans]